MKEEKKIEERLEVLKAMNVLAKSFNYEKAYMNWIAIVPDQADDEDLQDIAEDEEYFSEVVDVFKHIWETYLARGLYIGEKVY